MKYDNEKVETTQPIWINRTYFTQKWIERAEKAEEVFDKADGFISLWIAFNGWMRGKFGESKGDRELIEEVKKLEDMKNLFSGFKKNSHNFIKNLNELENFSIVNMKFIDDRSKDKKYDGTFESLIDTIYQIRCNLFHGRKGTTETEKDYKFICLAYDILSPLFKKYLKHYEWNKQQRY